MPIAAAPIIAAGISTLGGWFANRGRSQSSTPTLDPSLQSLQSTIQGMLQQRLAQPSALPAGYEAGEISNINRVFDLVGQRSANDLTARGLGTSPVAGVVEGNNQLARGSSIVELLQRIPMLNRQLQNDDLAMGSNLLAQGRGMTTQQSGNPAGGAFSNLAGMLGYLMESGRLGGRSTGVRNPNLPVTPGFPGGLPGTPIPIGWSG